MSASYLKPPPLRIGNVEHLSAVIESLLDDLERGVEAEIEKRGGFHGVVRVEQQRLAQTLDALVAGRDLDRLDAQEAAENERSTKRARALHERSAGS